LGADVGNSRENGRFLEQRDAEDLEKFVEAHVESEMIPNDGHEDKTERAIQIWVFTAFSLVP
jgi:hypothetical protein